MIKFLQDFSELSERTQEITGYAAFFLFLLLCSVLAGIYDLISDYIKARWGKKED